MFLRSWKICILLNLQCLLFVSGHVSIFVPKFENLVLVSDGFKVTVTLRKFCHSDRISHLCPSEQIFLSAAPEESVECFILEDLEVGRSQMTWDMGQCCFVA